MPGSTPGTASFRTDQGTLYELGFDVDRNGVYDAKTSAAVLEFRGAAGLPIVDRIDDAFEYALGVQYDAALAAGQLRSQKAPPVSPGHESGAGSSSTSGFGGMALGLLMLVGYFATRKKK
jgi:peptidoglycan hydrolase-like protein with peptidoglycan-binding domain